MKLRHLVPSLAIAAATIPAASAFEVDGDGWQLSIEPRFQLRAAFASASSADGETDYDIWEKQDTDNPQALNFMVRRARVYFKGGTDDGWKFNYTIMADNIGRADDRDNANIDVRYAYLGKKIKTDNLTHYIQFGLDKNTAAVADTDSSSKLLFPNGRLVAGWTGPRSIGLKYKLSAPVFSLDAGLADETSDENNDWHFHLRLASCLKEEWKLKKRSESYLGKDGFGHEAGIGINIKTDGSDDPDGTEDDDHTVIFLDYLVHYNQITGLVDIALPSTGDAGKIGGTGADTSGMIANAQIGYAVPLDSGCVAEPAFRLTYIDADDDDDDEAGVLQREGGASGIYVDAGVNYYFDGHSNKIQAAVQYFTPEEGDGDGFVFRIQHQLDF
ncbi:MAG: porin [Planctomycetota bacterium]